MAGIKIDITANSKDFAKQIREFNNETRKLNAEQKRSINTTRNLAKEEDLLLKTTQKNSIATRRFAVQQKRLENQERRLEQQTERLNRSQAKLEKTMGFTLSGAQSLGAGLAAIATGVAVKGLFDIGAELENVTIKFETLLGSSTKANERLEEIEKFSAKTPFQFPEVAKTSSLLETFGGELLSTGKNLELVGDATAIAGVRIEELAVDFGRLFSGLQEGGNIGDPLARFQELGLISTGLRKNLEDLNKAGRGAKGWLLLQSQLGDKVGGAMKRLSQTASGLASTLKDQLFGLVRQSLQRSGAWNLLTEGLMNATNGMDDLSEKAEGANDVFRTIQETFSAIGVILNGVYETFKLVGNVISTLVVGAFQNIIEAVKASSDALTKFFKGDFTGALDSAGKGVLKLADIQKNAFDQIANDSQTWFESLRNGEKLYNDLLDTATKANEEFEKTPVVGRQSLGPIGEDKNTRKKGFNGSNPFVVDLVGFAEDDLDIDFEGEKKRQQALKQLREEAFKSTLDGELMLLEEQSNSKIELAQNDAELLEAIEKDSAQKRFEIHKRFQEAERKETMQTLRTTKDALGAGFATLKFFAGENKALNRGQAIANGALGITKTFATYGATPPGFAGASLIAANTALQVQEISRQKLANGGLVNGQGTGRSDSIPTSLSRNEFVVNSAAASRNMPELRAINNGDTSNNYAYSPVIHINSSSETEGSLSEMLDSQSDKFIEKIKEWRERGSFA